MCIEVSTLFSDLISWCLWKTITRLSVSNVWLLMTSYHQSYQYRKSHCGDKTVVRSSYLHNGISYTGKMTSLYWIKAQVSSAPRNCSDCSISAFFFTFFHYHNLFCSNVLTNLKPSSTTMWELTKLSHLHLTCMWNLLRCYSTIN